MDVENFAWSMHEAFFISTMFIGAFNARFLCPSIVYALYLSTYTTQTPTQLWAGLLFYLGACLYAGFRP